MTLLDSAVNATEKSRLSRRRFLGVAGATGAAGALGPSLLDAIDGSAAGAASGPVSGGTINWRMSSEATTLDPAGNTLGVGASTQGNVALALYDQLGTYNYKTSTFVPRTAASVTANSAQTVWTIKLNPGITFSDGTPYDASAINFHWNRIANPATASSSAAYLQGWTWTVVDAQTFQVTLPEPYGNFQETLSLPPGAIPSPTAVTKYGSLYGTSPSTTVGAGPYVLSNWVHGSALTMTKNAKYWQSGKPYVDTFIFTTVSDNPTALNGMLTDTFQMGYFSSADQNSIAMNHAGFPTSTIVFPSAYGIYYQFNATPYNDLRIRHALILAIDPVDANLKSSAGAAPLAGGKGTAFYPKGSPFYDSTVSQKMNNLAAAQKLINSYIAEKGAISGTQQLTCPANSFLVNMGTALQQQWSKLTGISFQLNVAATSAAAILAYSKGQFTVAITLDPAWYYPQDAYLQLYSTSPGNVTHYNNPKFDALITAGRGYQDVPHRKTYLNQMGQTLYNDAAYGRIYFEVPNNFAQKNVGNLNTKYNFSPANWPDPTNLYLSSSS
jgi:peptide/nickel transport system substrate-binding protein